MKTPVSIGDGGAADQDGHSRMRRNSPGGPENGGAGGEFTVPTVVTFEIMSLHAFVTHDSTAPDARGSDKIAR